MPQLPSKKNKPGTVKVEFTPKGLAAMLAISTKPKENKFPHIVVNAGAGTGKTITIVEGICRRLGKPEITRTYSQEQLDIFDAMLLGPSSNMAVVSYSKSIIADIGQRLPKGIEARTLHSFGYRTLLRHFPKISDGCVDSKLSAWKKAAPFFNGAMDHLQRRLVSTALPLLDMAKATLTPPGDNHRQRLYALAKRFGLLLPKTSKECDELFDLVEHLLSDPLQIAESGLISHADMIWLNVVLDLEPVTVYDLLCIDESQDLTACQQEWALRMGRRKMIVGDPNQSIGNWNGAVDDSMACIAQRLAKDPVGVVNLSLTMTRRCSKAVVKLANRIVTDYYAHPENADGQIAFKAYHPLYADDLEEGDFVLCRTNAPLIKEYYALVQEGLEVCVVGKKYGIFLLDICQEIPTVYDSLLDSISIWYLRAVKKLKEDEQGAKLILTEAYECLTHFASRLGIRSGITQLQQAIERTFVEEPDKNKVSLMTVHRSKGLEADNVYLLLLEKANNWIPYNLASTPAQLAEERRLEYVAITRARFNFTIVTDNLDRAFTQFLP